MASIHANLLDADALCPVTPPERKNILSRPIFFYAPNRSSKEELNEDPFVFSLATLTTGNFDRRSRFSCIDLKHEEWDALWESSCYGASSTAVP